MILIASLLLVGCADLPDKSSFKTSDKSQFQKGKNSTLSSSTNNKLITNLKQGKEVLAVAQFGIYESIAVLTLIPLKSRKHDSVINIKGSYFYLKHGKDIKLEGFLSIKDSKVKLTESFKEKITGYISFSSKDKTDNYWSLDNSSEKEIARLIHVSDLNKKNNVKKIETLLFEKNIQIRDNTLPENTQPFNEVSKVWISKLPDKSLAFHIQVIGENFHLGRLKGMAFPRKKKKNEYHHNSYLLGDECKLKIVLEKQSIIFKDVSCSQCCGARVKLDGVYKIKSK